MAKFCTNCGSPLDRSAKVCMSCGTVINGTATATSTPTNNTYTNSNTSNSSSTTQVGKSKVVAIILAFFFGTLGIHNFYLGYNQKGTIQLLITCITCGIGGMFVGLWAIIDIIMLATGRISVDGYGNPLVN